jgi:hypothetical protein
VIFRLPNAVKLSSYIDTPKTNIDDVSDAEVIVKYNRYQKVDKMRGCYLIGVRSNVDHFEVSNLFSICSMSAGVYVWPG